MTSIENYFDRDSEIKENPFSNESRLQEIKNSLRELFKQREVLEISPSVENMAI